MASEKNGTFGGEAYQPQEEVFFNDGREIALLHFIYKHPNLSQLRGNPQKVLDAIDEYGRTQKYLMNIGPYKSGTIVDLIEKEKPSIIVELGGYVGYSAIAFGTALRKAGGKRYYSLEFNAEFGAVIGSLVDLAGLSDIVKVVIGASSDSLRRLHSGGVLKQIDLLFLDHYKPLYVDDLKICEEMGLVTQGSILAADNVIKPGNPPYLEYVRSSVEEKQKKLQETELNGLHKSDDEDKSKIRGNPNLIYESQLIAGWEPSGVPDAIEITRCVGIASG